MNITSKPQSRLWSETTITWGWLVITLALLCFLFWDGLWQMELKWQGSEEYGYGYIVPFLSAFMIWQKKNELAKIEFTGSWFGVVIAVAGLVVFVAGEISTLYTIVQYGFLITLFGLAYAYAGSRAMRYLWVPLVFLIFMVPLPTFLFRELSASLQLISSELGVAVIRLFGISVYLEGNVIDLGTYKLQVVEACSGLRYLFPLTCLAFMTVHFFSAPFWMRALIFFSSIPITVLMNSFRVGVIGVLVEYWGESMAEGFLHDFEGWAVFMACIGLLIIEMWVLNRFFGGGRSFSDVFVVDIPEPPAEGSEFTARSLKAPAIAGLVIVVLSTVWAQSLDVREEIIPEHERFVNFPAQIGSWKGKTQRMEQIYVDTLKFDDYIMSDYVNGEGDQINFYIAYYASQRKGQSAHSPRSCLPGGGWRITSLTQVPIDGVTLNHGPVIVNRAVITQGEYTQLMYYWFQQRGRSVTNEYLVKWWLLWDSLTRNRSDGSLVRLTAFLKPGQTVDELDKQLTSFMKDVSPTLEPYLPE